MGKSRREISLKVSIFGVMTILSYSQNGKYMEGGFLVNNSKADGL